MGPTPASDQSAPDGLADAFVRLRRPVLRAARRWFPSLSPDDLEDVYQAAWLSALRTSAPIDNLEAYVYEAMHSQGLMELRRRRRRPAASLEQLDAGQGEADASAAGQPIGAAAEAAPDEQVEARVLGGLVREVLAELTPRQRQVAKLRWGWGLSREEIAAALGLSRRTVKRDLLRASERLAVEGEVIRAGRWCERRRSLVTAYALGVLSPAQQRRARLHLDGCPGCRALVIQQRHRAGLLAGLMPAPVPTAPMEVGASMMAVVEQLRDRTAELALGAKQQVALGVARASDPTPLAGARPGAVAFVIVGCMAASGGTYCAVEELSGAWRSPLRNDQQALAQRSSGTESSADRAERVRAQPSPPPVAEDQPPPAPEASPQPDAAPAPVPPPAPSPPPVSAPPPEPAATEFSPTPSAATAQPAPEPGQPSVSSGGGSEYSP